MRRALLLPALLAVPLPVLAAHPNDYVAQQLSFDAVRAPEAWNYETGNPDFVVAILDSGVDVDHPDLAANIWSNPGETLNGIDDDGDGLVDDLHGWNFVDGTNDVTDLLGRGTHVAGVVGAVGSNGMGVIGIAWQVKLLPVRVMDNRHLLQQSVDPAIGALAIRYAADRGAGAILVDFHTSKNDDALKAAVSYAIGKGAVVIAAAGDQSSNLDHSPVYPACWSMPGLLSVANVDQGAKLALSSNFGGSSVTLVAPGVNVFSTLPGGLAGPMTGTAQAAAHVAGGVALLRSLDPSLTPAQVTERITGFSSNRGILKDAVVTGSILDLGMLIAEKRETVDAHIIGPDKVRVGQKAVFDGRSSEGPIVEWEWKFGDPDDELGAVVPRSWQRPGTVGVELMVRTADNRTASIRKEITVTDDDWLSRIGCDVGDPSAPAGGAALGAGLMLLCIGGLRRLRPRG
jgi:subtilisin family serine protease